ncbi:hypothetical protein BDF20DRAFT_914943 [Mycotypha africana]|uniref:uncharacterized protein n=1 Tax=Mycotypha africana TaxID=64632 RepID=UPI0023017BC4|nr:uncharacterized protein BDF20DRAFT_914943 [Mycotypha africana]KAI8973513.1 hypothetical protein BDF20DRAFT_914943 [Mycotypha africana]
MTTAPISNSAISGIDLEHSFTAAAPRVEDRESSAYKERHKVLRLLYDVLKYPEDYCRRRYTDQILDARDDYGMVPLKLLHNKIDKIRDYPYQYLQYCLQHVDADHSYHDNFVVNSDLTEVGLKSDRRHFETDPYGYYTDGSVDEDDSIQKGVKAAEKPKSDTTPSKRLGDAKKSESLKNRKKQRMAEVEPVIFKDGTFYADYEHRQFFAKCVSKERDGGLSLKQIYDFDVISDIAALGSSNPFSVRMRKKMLIPKKICFNCGKPNHEVRDCPEPRDAESIRTNAFQRKYDAFLKQTMDRRLHEFLELQQIASKMEPGKLSDELKRALGMDQTESEPPYYVNMRKYGYPPGYLKRIKASGSEVSSDDEEDEHEIKIFANEEDYLEGENAEAKQTAKTSKSSISSSTSLQQQQYSYIQTVTYPGLYPDTTYDNTYHTFNNYQNQYAYYGIPSYDQRNEYQYQQQYHYTLQEAPNGTVELSYSAPYQGAVVLQDSIPQNDNQIDKVDEGIVIEDDQSEDMVIDDDSSAEESS